MTKIPIKLLATPFFFPPQKPNNPKLSFVFFYLINTFKIKPSRMLFLDYIKIALKKTKNLLKNSKMPKPVFPLKIGFTTPKLTFHFSYQE